MSHVIGQGFLTMILIGFHIEKSVAASAYGAADSLVVVVAWIYYVALLLYFGAEFTRVYACTLGSQRDVEDLTNRAGRSFDRAKQTRSGDILS